MLTQIDQDFSAFSRRDFLKTFMATGILSTLPAAVLAKQMNGPHYTLNLKNAHTGEKFQGVYRIGDYYVPEAFEELSFVLRDFRTGDVHPIDPRLMDAITSVHVRSGSRDNFEIISGYRSPQTNAMLRRTTSGVSKNSYHMKGQAIDLRLPGYSTENLRKIAMDLRAGGVGYYPQSNFIHMDTGDIRSW